MASDGAGGIVVDKDARGVTVACSGHILVGGTTDVTVYYSADRRIQRLKKPINAGAWCPRRVTATDIGVLVCNCVPAPQGGGVYRYRTPNDTGILELICERPLMVALIQKEDRDILICMNGGLDIPGTLTMYSREGSAKPTAWKTVASHQSEALTDPRYMAVCPMTGHLLVSHGGGVTAMQVTDFQTVWSYARRAAGVAGDLRTPRGLYVDNAGRVYVADQNEARVVVLSSDGQYLTTIKLPSSGGVSLQGVASSTGRDLLVVDKRGQTLLAVSGYDQPVSFCAPRNKIERSKRQNKDTKELYEMKNEVEQRQMELEQCKKDLENARQEIENLKIDKQNLHVLVNGLRKEKMELEEQMKIGKEASASKDVPQISKLTKNRTFLVDNLVTDDIVDHLIQHDILSFHDQEIIASKPTTKDKARKLLDMLPYRGPTAYHVFRESLRERWQFIVDRLDATKI